MLWSALAGAVPGVIGEVDVGEGGTLEGEEVDLLDVGPGLHGVGEHADHGGVDGVLILDPRGPGGEQEDLVLVDAPGEDIDEAAVDADISMKLVPRCR